MLADVGRPTELINQIKLQKEENEAIAAIDATATTPSDLFATVEEKSEAVLIQAELGDDCNRLFSPELASIAVLMMQALTNPTTAGIQALQLLMDELGIKFPGFDLPDLDISLPSLDFDISLGGGFDINSMMKGLAKLLTIPPIGNCGVLLPDIGPGAALMAGALPTGLPEGESGGLANPFKSLGNKKIKKGFDKLGNPIQIVINSGAPATIAQSAPRAQATPAAKGTFDFPGYAGGGLQSSENKPPVYAAIKEAIGEIKEEVKDPFFSELIKLKTSAAVGPSAFV
jgi:hypothetical protein